MVMPTGLCDGVRVTECENMRMGRAGLVPVDSRLLRGPAGGVSNPTNRYAHGGDNNDSVVFDDLTGSAGLTSHSALPHVFSGGDDGGSAVEGDGLGALLCLRTESAGEVVATVGAQALSGEYGRCVGRLEARDALAMGRLLVAAWNDAVERAESTGVLARPRLAGWRLRDASGGVVYTSVPVLLSGADDGPAFGEMEPLVCGVTKGGAGYFNRTGDVTVRVTGAAVWLGATRHVEMLPQELAGMHVEVLMMPAMELVTGTGAGSMLGEVNSTTGILTLRLPGTYTGNEPAVAKGVAAIERQLAEWPHGAAVTGRYTMDEALAGVNVAVDVTAGSAVGEGAAAQFTAAVRYDSGDSYVYGDVTMVTPCQLLPVQQAMESDRVADPVRQQTVTRWRNGAVTVDKADAAYVPVKTGALIVAHGSGVESMTMEAATATGKRSATVAMRSAPGGGDYSYWISPTLQRLVLTESGEAYAEAAPEGDAGEHSENMVMIATAGSPMVPTARLPLVNAGRVYCIERAAGASAAWNFGRKHFTVWTAEGVYALTANSGGTRLAASLISRTGVAGHGAVAATPDALYAATAQGQAVRLSGTTLQPYADLPQGHIWTGVVYDMEHDELLWTDSEGLVTVTPRNGSGWWTQRGVVVAGEPVRMMWSGRMPTGMAGRGMLTGLRVDMCSADCRITVRVSGHGGAQDADGMVTMAEAEVAGAVDMPVTLPMRCLLPEWITVTIEGDMDAASVVRGVRAMYVGCD